VSTPAVYLTLLRARLRSRLQYRASFVVDVVMNAAISAIEVVSLLVVFHVTPSLAGFSLREALVIAGLAGTAFALGDLTVGNVRDLDLQVRSGSFDALLVRPLGTLPQLVVGDVAFQRLGRTLQAVAVLAVAVSIADINWTPARVLLLLAAPLAGAVIFGSLIVTGATLAFWVVEAREAANSITYGGRDFTTYPLPVYTGWFRRVFGYALPFAFVAYLPALALLGRPDPLGIPGWLGWCSPLVAVPCAAGAGLAWRAGVRHYRSTGS
jgi:ABC-2 type transport system permease protein